MEKEEFALEVGLTVAGLVALLLIVMGLVNHLPPVGGNNGYQTVGKRCVECGNPVPMSSKLGDTCPHCGVTWDTDRIEKTDRTEKPAESKETQEARQRLVIFGFGSVGTIFLGFLLVKYFDPLWEFAFGSRGGTRKTRRSRDLKTPNGKSIPDEDLSKNDLQFKYGMSEGEEIYHRIHD